MENVKDRIDFYNPYRFFSFLLLLFISVVSPQDASCQNVAITQREDGWRLTVAGENMFIKGMNWDYFPIGTNYEYSLWVQSDQFIRQALDDEMKLLQAMGVNAIRLYVPVPKKWITYIYEKYGIFTVLNHSFGRYGLALDGSWLAKTDYGDPAIQSILLEEVNKMAIDYIDTPGLLIFLLGNENNYGLFWEGAETEEVPDFDEKGQEQIARELYKLYDLAAKQMKANNPQYPIAICNGDLQFIDLIKEECKHVDILGINIYRGASFGNAFDIISQKIDKPVMLTEFGSDAFNAITQKEAQDEQALILAENWKEIYQNAAGQGRAENVIGGLTFQFSDGWWKHGQTQNLDVHDTHASWSNGGYSFDYQEGVPNMNEEWFGICAKGETRSDGSYSLKPRKAYYMLQHIHQIDPYQDGVDSVFLIRFFQTLNP